MNRYQIRRLGPGDVPFAQQLRRIAHWNQTDADWRRLLALGGEGCFLIHCDGRPAGTATTTVYAGQLAWIGMILVHPSFRGRGLATALVRHCLNYLLSDLSIRCVKLDATAEGQRLYGKLGFQVDYELTRWEGQMSDQPPRSDRPSPPVDRSEVDDSEAWLALDRSVFGADRSGLLRRLAHESRRTIQYGGQSDCHGYGMLREGAEANYLGPVVASEESIGSELVRDLLTLSSHVGDQTSRVGGEEAGEVASPRSLSSGRGAARSSEAVYWDIPKENRAAERLAEQLGFIRQRPLIRMWTGRANLASDARGQWAIAGPETG